MDSTKENIIKNDLLSRFGDKASTASKGGLSYFTKDNTDQDFKNNKNDLIFYDVNDKGDKADFNTLVKQKVFQVNTAIEDSGLNPNDEDNENEYNHLENAINLAMCGAWNGGDTSLCVSPWGKKDGKNLSLVNYAKTPSIYRNDGDIKDVENSFNKFIDDNTRHDIINTTDISGDVSKIKCYNGMAYYLNKYLVSKSRFYNSNKSINYNQSGWGSVINIFNDPSIGTAVKSFVFIVLLLSFYLILRGVSTVTKSDFKFTPNTKNMGGFALSWIVLLAISLGPQFDQLKNYYSLFSGNYVKLNEPCKNSKDSQLRDSKYIVIFISVILVSIYIYIVSSSHVGNGSQIGYIAKLLLMIGFAMLIGYSTTPNFFNQSKDDKKEFRMSYVVDGVNELPYQNRIKASNINLVFWCIIFFILIVASLGKAFTTVITGKNSDGQKQVQKDNGIDDFLGPWMTLRGPFVIAFNLVLAYIIPYYLIIYPIVCMLQRLFVGSTILPYLMNKVFNKSNPPNESEKLVLFNTFVGWDLPGWPFFKIIDVLSLYINGKDPDKILKSTNNTSNYKVFSSFDDTMGFLKPFIAILYTLAPWWFIKKFDEEPGLLSLILFVIIGALGGMWLSKIILTTIFSKPDYTFFQNFNENKAINISSIVIYIVAYLGFGFFYKNGYRSMWN